MIDANTVTYDTMSEFAYDDIRYRIAVFAANKLGTSKPAILVNPDLMKAAAKLFWDAYFENEVEL